MFPRPTIRSDNTVYIDNSLHHVGLGTRVEVLISTSIVSVQHQIVLNIVSTLQQHAQILLKYRTQIRRAGIHTHVYCSHVSHY